MTPSAYNAGQGKGGSSGPRVVLGNTVSCAGLKGDIDFPAGIGE